MLNTFTTTHPYTAASKIPDRIISEIDAIIVLGGGPPSSIDTPPVYVQDRCENAADIFHRSVKMKQQGPPILTLSAGTAHAPQLMSDEGLPIWESTGSAAYLIEKLQIPEKYIFVETTSYDTISNAFFTRTSFSDITGWRKLLIITDEFHMQRSKAIFDWILSAKSISGTENQYCLYYLSTNNRGLTKEGLEARNKHELKGYRNVVQNLSKKYDSLHGVWEFLTEHHTFYNSKKLVDLGKLKNKPNISNSEKSLLQSYGGIRIRCIPDNAVSVSDSGGIDLVQFTLGIILGLVMGYLLVSYANKSSSSTCKLHVK